MSNEPKATQEDTRIIITGCFVWIGMILLSASIWYFFGAGWAFLTLGLWTLYVAMGVCKNMS
jgi:hypothetical protein